ncbi:xanthine dehydrogenase family protein molybdopterin-binding subunit [Natrarchaeobius halalkaliphilus]|uniref:Xanthine dehydrogenase family protein molybdopterin-binding subunit n=1 Tax=Natrarchaeobius halalkaliphilus TaxID=1679091 RepID=A0A3N6LLM2_9EURY|nr:xanthine dehydrogenase family protein molybdopterin-binding subunit [Natrarchaeobius halalkaliphilus]RQG88050.1 xanthine dehydrogenase family protein molybdopterin-binding subunit [Natrarchaeobius halalkaliphilus]
MTANQLQTEQQTKRVFSSVGTSHYGPDDRSKVTGELTYADDFDADGLLHANVCRSTRASATIEDVDTSEAEAIDGVEAVITAADVPNNKSASNVVGQSQEVGLLEAKHQVLADDVVRFFGEPIAIVAATDPQIASEATERIRVSYGSKEGVFDPREAMEPDAPEVHGGNNVIARWKLREGDVDEAFEDAAVVVEDTYETSFQEHAHLEPESGVSWIDDDGVLNLRVATQVIEQYREVAEILDLPESKVRVRGTLMGGGFGGKEDLTVEPYIALLTWETGRPVKLTYDRDEMFVGRHKRSPFTVRYKHAADEDGNLVAVESELVSDSGAYVYLSPWILMYATYHSTGPYDIPNVKADGYSVLTNNTPGSAFRSFGAVEATFGVEQQIDAIARELEMDPAELRRKNYFERGDTTATGQPIDSAVMLGESQDAALDALGEPSQSDDPDVVVGQGFASSWQSYGRMRYLGDISSSWVGLEKDGSAIVRSGIPDLGGGQRESLRQIASEELGIPTEDIQVNSSDTQSTPLGGTVTASRGLYMSGNAVRKTANTLRQQILEKAGDLLEEDADDLDISDGVVHTSGRTNEVSVSDVVIACHAEGNPLQNLETFRAPTEPPIEDEILEGSIFPDFTFSTQAAEVEVNTRTGEVSVSKLALAHDVGKAINPSRVQGQIEGGAVQGLGYALMEDYSLDDGVPLTRNLSDYKLPSTADAPEMETIILESESGNGPYGAKGIGEPSITATPAAILNGIYDAIGGRVTELPASPEKVFTAMTEADD